jgi:hypothetical protein
MCLSAGFGIKGQIELKFCYDDSGFRSICMMFFVEYISHLMVH